MDSGELNIPSEESEPIEESKFEGRPQDTLRVKWVMIITMVVFIIGGSVFYSVARFVELKANTRSIRDSCHARNENIKRLNYKIDQLNVLVDARLRDRPDGTPNPPDVIAAAEALKEPIPLTSCKGL